MNPWNVLFPFQKYMKNFTSSPQGKEMESYMSNMFTNWQKNGFSNDSQQNTENQTFYEQESTHQSSHDGTSLFETHTDVYVRVPIKDASSLKNIKIFHTSNTSIIEGYPNKEDRQVYTLPAIVKKRGGSAQYREGMLEIKLPKATDLQFSEINVTELK